ncbi:MAG: photosystem II biosynthesis protein [Cyanobium sp.]
MPSPRKGRPFVPRGAAKLSAQAPRQDSGKAMAPSPARRGSQVIPDRVANRMARRVALATGIPTVMGMGVFVVSYLLVSRKILDIPPSATLLASGACFLLGLIGLSYGVLSASWEDASGSILGTEQIALNISRIRASLAAMRQGNASG